MVKKVNSLILQKVKRTSNKKHAETLMLEWDFFDLIILNAET